LMCTFFFNCHTYTLASEPKLEQPSWLNYQGQFSQKKVWSRVGKLWRICGDEWKICGEGKSVTLSNAQQLLGLTNI